MVRSALRQGAATVAARGLWTRREPCVLFAGGLRAHLSRHVHDGSKGSSTEPGVQSLAAQIKEASSSRSSPSPSQADPAPAEEKTIAIDKAGLYGPAKMKLPKERLSDLGILMYAYLRQFGPLSVADYMDLCLAHPRYGYYKQEGSEKIGKGGDFITAPEISQMFGELIGVWGVASWEKMGMPRGMRLAEIGPGKGTLMKDLLRACRSFKNFSTAVESVHLIETSLALREEQAKALGGKKGEDGKSYALSEEDGGKPVTWHFDIGELPEGPLLLVGQELLDALPVHQFEYTAEGWRERVVVTDTDDSSKYHFKFVLADKPTPAVEHLQKSGMMPDNPTVGQGIEVCPLGVQIVRQVAERVAKHGGAALFIDYGEDETQPDTLRGLRAHAMVDVRSEPGNLDLSADVDFGALKRAVADVKGARAVGPIPQGQFLSALGIEVRLNALLDSPKISDKQALLLYDSYRRLVDPEQMGRKYKVIAIVGDSHQGPPVGF